MLLYEVHDGAELSAVMKEAATGPVRICEISPFRTMFRYLADCGLTLFADEHAQLYYKKEGTETAKPSSIQAMMDMCLSKLKEKRSEVSTTFQVECLEEDDRELAMIREDFRRERTATGKSAKGRLLRALLCVICRMSSSKIPKPLLWKNTILESSDIVEYGRFTENLTCPRIC